MVTFKTSNNPENFEQCVEKSRPLLELYEEFEQLFSNLEENPMAVLEFVLGHDSNALGCYQVNQKWRLGLAHVRI